MPIAFEDCFNLEKYYKARDYARNLAWSKGHGYKLNEEPFYFDIFKFKEGDIVEVVDPTLGLTHSPWHGVTLEDYRKDIAWEFRDSGVASIGRKYVIAKVTYPDIEESSLTNMLKQETNPLGIPTIHVYIDRPDELDKLNPFAKKVSMTTVHYFKIRPVPTKEDLDLNKLSYDKLARYTELVNEYNMVINARAHQDRIEQGILDLFGITKRNKEEVLDMIKEKMGEE